MTAGTTRRDTGDHALHKVLGGLPVAEFLRRHWQKRPLVVRAAVPGVDRLVSARELVALALRDDVESRLVVREGRRWSLTHGPFRRADFRGLPGRNWTLLVQGVNHVNPAADALLRRFAFVPYARLDDLMVSYAAPGGGVGPHIDSYDVFLIQGFGRRRWRFGRQRDVALEPRLPLAILRRFEPEQREVFAPGDLLYLPPQWAHEGVAIDACTTYSVGFRAAAANELVAAFLDFLRDEIEIAGRYVDPDLAATRTPAAIDRAMQRRHADLLARLRWDRATIARFVGCWLSEPKPNVIFEPPTPVAPPAKFLARATRDGVRLDLRTRLLYDAWRLYVNGTALRWPAADCAVLRRLANARALRPREVAGAPLACATLMHGWYRDGYLHVDS